MARRRRRHVRGRAADIARRQRRSLMQLVMAVIALVMLFVLWNQLAEGAAGCFGTVAGEGAARPDAGSTDDARHDAGGEGATPNVRVKKVKGDAGDP
ncbi:MAG: hypothetical protein ACQEXJ_01680 [Myxococcota bacterium]